MSDLYLLLSILILLMRKSSHNKTNKFEQQKMYQTENRRK